MTTQMRPFSMIAGDDLQLDLQLIDQDGKPYNLDSLEDIQYLLHDPEGRIVPIEALIKRIDPATGRIRIWLPAGETSKLLTGAYTNWLRVRCGGFVSTLFTGPMSVTADPWKAEETTEFEAAISPHTITENVILMLDAHERIVRQPANDDEAAEWRASVAARRGGIWPLLPRTVTFEEWRRSRLARSRST